MTDSFATPKEEHSKFEARVDHSPIPVFLVGVTRRLAGAIL